MHICKIFYAINMFGGRHAHISRFVIILSTHGASQDFIEQNRPTNYYNKYSNARKVKKEQVLQTEH